MSMKVAAGIIFNEEGEILIAKRIEPEQLAGLWEFPGGKIEKSETPQQCIKREIEEEFGLRIELRKKITTIRYQYDFGEIELHVFLAGGKNGKAETKEHEQIRWTKEENLHNYDLAPADRKILEEMKVKEIL